MAHGSGSRQHSGRARGGDPVALYAASVVGVCLALVGVFTAHVLVMLGGALAAIAVTAAAGRD